MKKPAILAIVALLALSACNTVKGMGEDVSTAGNSMSNTAGEVQSDM